MKTYLNKQGIYITEEPKINKTMNKIIIEWWSSLSNLQKFIYNNNENPNAITLEQVKDLFIKNACYDDLCEYHKSLKFEESILERRLNAFPKTILMYALIKDKHTFVYQPIKQKFNLRANGWVEVEDFNNFIKTLNL